MANELSNTPNRARCRNMFGMFSALFILLALPLSAPAQEDAPPTPAQDAAPPPPDPAKAPPALAAVIASLHPQQGKIAIGDGLATLDMPKGLGYLPPDQADALLHKVYNVPWTMKNLGAIIPTTVEIGSPAFWYSVITYREDGHVDDSNASLDAGVLMKQMQEDNARFMAKLKEHGYSSYGATIAGWTTTPHLDAAAHKLHWGIEFVPSDSKDHVINYHIRVLGRSGVISTIILCRLEQLPMVEDSGAKILSSIQFNTPHRYADFNAGADKQAPYTIADIIEGHNNVNATGTPPKKSSFVWSISPRTLLILGLFLVAIFYIRKFNKDGKNQGKDES